MVVFTKQDITNIVNELLSSSSKNITANQVKQVENCVWREINIKQGIKEFENTTAGNLRIEHLTKWYYNAICGKY